MDIVRGLMQIISVVLGIYSFIIFVRIVLTWFQGAEFGRIQEYLARITDPYLNWFRQFEFLRIGGMDFSIIAGLITLWIVRSIAANIAFAGTISFGRILAIVLMAIAGAVFFFLTLFLILAVVRLLGSLFGANTALRFWIVVDQIIEPMVHKIVLPLAGGRFVSYQNALLIFSGVVLVTIIAGRFLVNVLAGLLIGLPF